MSAFASPATTAAAASPIGSRSIIPAGWRSLRRSTSCRPYDMWHGIDASSRSASGTGRSWRCRRRFPRTMIGRDPVDFLEPDHARHQGEVAGVRSARSTHYHAFFQRPAAHPRRPARTIAPAAPPTSRRGRPRRATRSPVRCSRCGARPASERAETDPLAIWREWANDVRGFAIDSGHFLPEENPARRRRR